MEKLTIEQIITKDNRDNRNVGDGLWDVSGVEEIVYLKKYEDFYPSSFLKRVSPEDKKTVEDFCNKHPNWCFGEAYQCYGVYLLSNKPVKFNGKQTGYFGHGANCLIENCPSKLLLLAQDD